MRKTGIALLFGLISSVAYAGQCSVDAEATASMAFNLFIVVSVYLFNNAFKEAPRNLFEIFGSSSQK